MNSGKTFKERYLAGEVEFEEIDDYSDDFSLENFVEKAIDEIDWNVGEDDSIDPLKEKKHLKKRVG